MTRQHQIAIIGGGPGGLSLARLLQLGDKENAYNIKVYERDVDANVRITGGSLDLHTDSGLIFIDKAGLRKEYEAVARPEGGFYTLCTQEGQVVWKLKAPQHPETDRNDLRKLLLNSLETDTVEWNKHMVRIEKRANGGYDLYFKNDPNPVYCDAIIGADGASSKVRSFLSPSFNAVYSGVTLIQGDIADPFNQCPELMRRINKGQMWVMGTGGRSIAFQEKTDGTLIFYASIKADEGWMEKTHKVDYSTKDIEVWRQIMLSIYHDFDSLFTDAIRVTDDFTLRKCYGLMYRSTLNDRWNPTDITKRDLVTLLGDSAHVMPSFAGVGVNNAMVDALELAEELCRQRNDQDVKPIAGAFSAYEKRMLKRCIQAAQLTAKMEDNFHHEENIKEITKAFSKFAPIELDSQWSHLLD